MTHYEHITFYVTHYYHITFHVYTLLVRHHILSDALSPHHISSGTFNITITSLHSLPRHISPEWVYKLRHVNWLLTKCRGMKTKSDPEGDISHIMRNTNINTPTFSLWVVCSVGSPLNVSDPCLEFGQQQQPAATGWVNRGRSRS